MFDFVIVGAGPAGCVLAHRLSADPNIRVLLLESGPEDKHPFIHMPKGIARILADPAHTWVFGHQWRKDANAPPAPWARGRTLGGSSAVNGLMYVRGQPADYDELAEQTSDDWSWAHIGQAFKAMEHHSLPSNETRGDAGPWRVTTSPRATQGEPLLEAVIEAAGALGVPREEDTNTPNNAQKIGYGLRTIFKGRRQSAAVAFLTPVRGRRNLEVVTGATVDRVIFEGTRAVGVAASVNGAPREFRGGKVILCGGTLGSPAILQRSGVGPAELLKALDIPVVADRPQVGENLREHCSLIMQWRAKNTRTNNPWYRGPGLWWSVLRYYLTRTGPLSEGAIEIMGFVKTNPGVDRANGQVLMSPHTFDYSKEVRTTEDQPGFMISNYLLRPRSQGQVRITAKDPAVMPSVVLDYMKDPDDRRERLELIRFVRKLVRTEPLARYAGEETRPGEHLQTDEELLEALHAQGTPAYHAAGTCRMGKDADSVVDPKTRVRGVDNLHVVDLSITPSIPAGNTQAPVAVLAWRAADLILAERGGGVTGAAVERPSAARA